MNEKLHKYLDGELPLDALTPEERAEAAEWQTLLTDAQELRSEKAPAWLETRVMANLPAEPARGWARRAIHWLTAPQPLHVRPLSLGFTGAAAALVLFLFVSRNQPTQAPVAVSGPANVEQVAAREASVIYVQFVLADHNAKDVAVAGDFNDWDVAATPLTDPDGNGVWTGLVALRPGVHKYMFVVDGKRWVTDPEAERYVDDGFGMRNAVITIVPPQRGRSI